MIETQFTGDRSAFTIRRPKLKLWHLGIIGLLIATAIFLSIFYGNEIIRNTVIVLVSAAIVGLIYLIQNRSFDERTATEFQSSVFSGAMRSNSLLTFIIYRDGSVFYHDPRYSQTFPKGTPNHNVDQFLTTIGLQSKDKIHIYDAIKDLTKAEFEYLYNDEVRKNIPLKIGVYPLQRPEGFVAVNVMET